MVVDSLLMLWVLLMVCRGGAIVYMPVMLVDVRACVRDSGLEWGILGSYGSPGRQICSVVLCVDAASFCIHIQRDAGWQRFGIPRSCRVAGTRCGGPQTESFRWRVRGGSSSADLGAVP